MFTNDISLIFDIVGIIGAGLTVLCFFLLQKGKIKADSYAYLITNSIAAIMILISLSTSWNLPAAINETLWLAISLYGIPKVYFRKDH